jgi:hypothetical protein
VERSYRSGLITGVAISIIAAMLTPVWRPALSRWGRPVAKGAIKQGLDVYDSGRGKLAELSESLEDLVAEAMAERMGDNLKAMPTEAVATQSPHATT